MTQFAITRLVDRITVDQKNSKPNEELQNGVRPGVVHLLALVEVPEDGQKEVVHALAWESRDQRSRLEVRDQR